MILARYYDPVIGRFTGVDPIADAFADLSPFNYAANNPSTMIDLWGLQAFDPNNIKGYVIEEVTCCGKSFSHNPHFWGVPYGSSSMDPQDQEDIWNAIHEDISRESTAAGQAADEQGQQEILARRQEEYQKRLDESLDKSNVEKLTETLKGTNSLINLSAALTVEEFSVTLKGIPTVKLVGQATLAVDLITSGGVASYEIIIGTANTHTVVDLGISIATASVIGAGLILESGTIVVVGAIVGTAAGIAAIILGPSLDQRTNNWGKKWIYGDDKKGGGGSW